MQVAMTTASSSIPPRASPSRSRRLETLVLFVEMGWCATAWTFIAMNLGAGQKRRAHRAGGLAALYNVVLTAGMVALFLVYSSEIVGFFDKSPGVIMFSREYMLSIAPSYIVLVGALVLSQAMTGVGATLTNLVIEGAVWCY